MRNLTKWFAILTFVTLSFIQLSGCATTPPSYLRVEPPEDGRQVRVAIIPFSNFSSENQADRKVTYALITYLLNSRLFDVVEMGVTQKAMNDAKVRKDEPPPLEAIKKMGELTGADVLLMGAVEEYKIDSGTMLGDKVFVPEVSINARLVSTHDGSIVWSANHHRRGDDRVTVFGMGRVESISELTEIIVRDTIRSLSAAVRTRQGALRVMKNGFSRAVPPPAEPPPVEEPPVRTQAPEPAKPASAPAAAPVSTAAPAPAPAVAEPPPAPPRDEKEETKEQYKKAFDQIKTQYS